MSVHIVLKLKDKAEVSNNSVVSEFSLEASVMFLVNIVWDQERDSNTAALFYEHLYFLDCISKN